MSALGLFRVEAIDPLIGKPARSVGMVMAATPISTPSTITRQQHTEGSADRHLQASDHRPRKSRCSNGPGMESVSTSRYLPADAKEWSEARQERRCAMRSHQSTYESSMPTRNYFEATRLRQVTLRKAAEPACGHDPRFIAGRRSGSPDPRSRPGGCLAVRTLARFDARRRCDDKFRSRRGAGRRRIPQPCQCTRHRGCMSLDG